MKKDTSKASDFIVGIGIIVLSLIFYFEAKDMPEPELGIGPGQYPAIICGVLFVLGLVQVVRTLVVCKGIPLIEFKTVNGRFLLRAAIMVVLTYLYYKCVKKVGFLLLTPVYMYLAVLLFGYRKKIKGAVVTVIFTTSIYFLFVKVFQVLLPRGILG